MEVIKNKLTDEILEEIKTNGFVKLKVAEKDFVDELFSFFKSKELSAVNSGFYSTIMHPDIQHKIDVNTFLLNHLQQIADQFIPGYKGLFANYLVKSPGSNRPVGLHQDWTYTDETKFHSFNIWMPLVKTGKENGGLVVVPKSHNLPFSYRYTPFDENLYAIDIPLLEQHSFQINTEIGDAVIYDSRLLHYSKGNPSNEYRVVIAGIFLPNEAPALHFYKEGSFLEVYKTNLEFYCRLEPGVKPLYNSIQKIPFIGEPDSNTIIKYLTRS